MFLAPLFQVGKQRFSALFGSPIFKRTIAQGVRGEIGLVTGNFSYFINQEAKAIEAGLNQGKLLVLVYDRDSIAVPANERAMWIREYFRHQSNLEVRVAYGPPPEHAGNEVYLNYINRQLPSDIRVKSIHCNNPYSDFLAKSLGVPLIVASEDKKFNEVEALIKQDPQTYEALISPIARERILNAFKQVIDPQFFLELCEQEKKIVADDIEKLNPEHPNRSTFFSRTAWDLMALNKPNLPVMIGNIGDPVQREAFSNLNNTQVFDMPVCIAGQWSIPQRLTPYLPVIAKVVAAESLSNPDIDRYNMYATIDCGVVHPSGFARRGGLHVDGFLTSANAISGSDRVLWGDNTYIVSDRSELQTRCYPGPFDLSRINLDDPKAVLKTLDFQGRNMSYRQYNPYDILRLNTNNVHAVQPNLSGYHLARCFAKFTFSERLFNRGGNTVNPNLNYRFLYVPRESGRNTQNFIGDAPEGYTQVILSDIDFKIPRFPDWVSSTPVKVSKNPNLRVLVTPAVEGEELITEVNGDKVTTNIARAGDMKVSRTPKDCYFLGSNFFSLYEKTDQKDEYKPRARPLTGLKVLKDITFLAPWGTRQNIRKGGFIIQDSSGETWGVHEESFEASYMKIG